MNLSFAILSSALGFSFSRKLTEIFKIKNVRYKWRCKRIEEGT
jgi:hypothetical protein